MNDHAAGLSAAVAVLAALDIAERTGEGQHVDIAQMETGAYLIGPALLDLVANGREAHPDGNVDPFGCLVPLVLELTPEAQYCVATPAQENRPSWVALDRAGFRRHGRCQPPEEPLAWTCVWPRDVTSGSNRPTSE